ncbi:hypothetical protein TrRE_jg164 [Triparma retinervis]|uniref:Uncharacterized protein n=1 Tax=Triparma retinervis TaxID=2557542 RepID=A0A9W7G013_9STRA|nr:hypothetical protein TrRE_jg164 [Triparma retinervis]
MKLIAKGMKCLDWSFKTSQLKKAQLQLAIEERSVMTFDGVEWFTMRRGGYLGRAFPRIPSKIVDKVEARVEVFIGALLTELDKKTLAEAGDDETLRNGVKVVTARFWTHDSESGDLAVAFLRIVIARMKNSGEGGGGVEQFAVEFEKLYGDKAERDKFDGGKVGEKRKNEGSSGERSSPPQPVRTTTSTSTAATAATTAATAATAATTATATATTTATTITTSSSSGAAINRYAPPSYAPYPPYGSATMHPPQTTPQSMYSLAPPPPGFHDNGQNSSLAEESR